LHIKLQKNIVITTDIMINNDTNKEKQKQ